MLPAEPMTPQFTLGGVVSTASHGSGLRHAPVADRVIALEYVDEKGEVVRNYQVHPTVLTKL